ncbi:MAG: prepilin-type N-terminal cleavage/methylation domain-containing protein, partial [Bacilli bacterium]|nr:prepilin-type N-terminal cleavage/methylation domain-containing protein [Bacilli bacterium]
MKNKKGFTLVELLSVIVLLGIIITIGIFSVSSIRKTILDRQYKNLKTEIEIAAEKYYSDTEST